MLIQLNNTILSLLNSIVIIITTTRVIQQSTTTNNILEALKLINLSLNLQFILKNHNNTIFQIIIKLIKEGAAKIVLAKRNWRILK
jgi:hypothetical protein